MRIEINYFDDKFSIKDADLSKVQPFSHANVVVNCDLLLSETGGILERKVEEYLSGTVSTSGLRAKWDKQQERYQLQQRGANHPPRISELVMGVDFDM